MQAISLLGCPAFSRVGAGSPLHLSTRRKDMYERMQKRASRHLSSFELPFAALLRCLIQPSTKNRTDVCMKLQMPKAAVPLCGDP